MVQIIVVLLAELAKVKLNNVSFGKKGFKYFIGYKDGKKVRPLCILLPKLSA